jgi:hypothetical protein
VFAKEGSPDEIVASPKRLGRLSFEDGLRFDERRRLIASVRDFARLAWFWQSRGRWGRDQILPASYFDRYMRPDVPADLPRTKQAETSDKLAIGSFGGDSDHFATHGGGIYGFNFWFNACGAGNPTRPTWPDAPADTVMTLGHGGNNSVMIPSRRLVLVSAGGDWGELRPGDGETVLAKRLRQLAASARGVEP